MIFKGMFSKPVDWWKVVIYMGLFVAALVIITLDVWLLHLSVLLKLLDMAFQILLAIIVLNWLWNRSREKDL